MTDLDVYQPGQIDQYQGRMVMTPEAAKALDDQLTQCIRAILHEGTDYGVIPGTGGDKSLWRPGAQKLLLWFGLGFECDPLDIERDDDGRKQGVTYRATVFRRMPDGTRDVKATCEGYAGYDEDKFYQSEEQVKARLRDAEHKWAKKDRRVPNADRWNDAKEYRAPWNSVIKRAQKRAIVGATLDATAAGGRFNQDREEDDHAPVPQDDGPSWTEAALAQVDDFTEVEQCRELYSAAAEAHKKGLCNRKQQDLVQNTAAKRAKKLQVAVVVDVEDLADKAAADYAQAAAEDPQPEPADDTLPVEDPPEDWPQVVKPGTGQPKGK